MYALKGRKADRRHKLFLGMATEGHRFLNRRYKNVTIISLIIRQGHVISAIRQEVDHYSRLYDARRTAIETAYAKKNQKPVVKA